MTALAIVTPGNLGTDFDVGVRVPGKINFGLDSYRYKKAINASTAILAALPSGVAPVDAMLTFAQGQTGASPGSNVMQAATTNIPAPPSGDFETLVLWPWMQGATNASPPGLGLSSTSTPTFAAAAASLRSSATAMTYSSSNFYATQFFPLAF